MRTIRLLLILAALQPMESFAFPPAGNPNVKRLGTVDQGRLETLIDDDRKSMLNAHDGWNLDYYGYTRTPILFDPKIELDAKGGKIEKTDGLERKYPSLNWKGLLQVNLSVDDEINKTSMAIFQPITELERGFAQDEFLRDHHLGLFNTLQGIAQLTLSYLDKTVASGLMSIQSEVNAEVTNHMLQQIAWSSSKLASPERSPFYNDVEEKFEVCMFNAGSESMGSGRFESYECSDSCGDEPEGPGTFRFRYCVCCAERTSGVNSTVDPTSEGIPESEKGTWSLVRRVIHGTGLFSNEQELQVEIKAFLDEAGIGDHGIIPDDSRKSYGELVEDFVQLFRLIYGDVVMKPSVEDETRSRIKYVLPPHSVPELISQLRDGPRAAEEDCPADDPSACQECEEREGLVFCPITNGRLAWGICPALKHLIDPTDIEKDRDSSITPWLTKKLTMPSGWASGAVPTYEDKERLQANPTSAEYRVLLQLWLEASLGTMLNAHNFDMLRERKLERGDRPTVLRWTEAFCDASAVAAFRRLHQRMTSIVIDHIVLNQKATQADKARIRRLMDRVGEYLQLAEIDANAGRKAEAMLLGLNAENDVRRINEMTATQAGMTAEFARSRRNSNVFGWGWGFAAPRGSRDSSKITDGDIQRAKEN